MYLIILVTQRYTGNGLISEKIIGYKDSEEEAKNYCDLETPKLEYNTSMGNIYYRYEKIEKI